MPERTPKKESLERGSLLYLTHPDKQLFSGYGITRETNRKDSLVGLLMVDRPHPANPVWLQSVSETFGSFELYPMTAAGERGMGCQMHIQPDSVKHLKSRSDAPFSNELQRVLQPMLENPPAPVFGLKWDDEIKAWASEFIIPNELPPQIKEVFERTGYGCLALESDIGIVHVCHAPDMDIDGFSGKPIRPQWQLIEMPTAPLIRLNLTIFDRPADPFRFESFLNVDDKQQLDVLTQLASQEELYLAFYGDWLNHRHTMSVEHTENQWQQLDEYIMRALTYWANIPAHLRDFDKAKEEFMRRVP